MQLQIMMCAFTVHVQNLLQVFAIEFGDFAIEFVSFAIEFVPFAIEFFFFLRS